MAVVVVGSVVVVVVVVVVNAVVLVLVEVFQVVVEYGDNVGGPVVGFLVEYDPKEGDIYVNWDCVVCQSTGVVGFLLGLGGFGLKVPGLSHAGGLGLVTKFGSVVKCQCCWWFTGENKFI